MPSWIDLLSALLVPEQQWHGGKTMALGPKWVEASELEGFKYFDMISEFLPRLKDIGTERDKSQNRELFCDQYLALLILYFFNPTLTSLNALQQASELDKVQKLLGVKRISMGSLSEAGSVFDPQPLRRRRRGRGVKMQRSPIFGASLAELIWERLALTAGSSALSAVVAPGISRSRIGVAMSRK
jgi:hypothetical protein